jgi:hypothetical protein
MWLAIPDALRGIEEFDICLNYYQICDLYNEFIRRNDDDILKFYWIGISEVRVICEKMEFNTVTRKY